MILRIAHFIYDSPYNPWVGGGGSIRNYEIYKRFPESFKIDLFSGSYPEAKNKKIKNNFNQIFLGKKTKSYILSRIFYVLSSIGYLKENASNYDIVIEDFSPFSNLFSWKFVEDSKLICQIQNFFTVKDFISKLGFFGIFLFFFQKRSLKEFKNFIFSSSDLKDKITDSVKLNIRRSVIISYGIENLLLKRNLIKKKQQILFLGRFEIYQKGLDRLIKIWKILSKEFPDLYLVFAGSGKDEKKLKNLTSKLSNIKYAGRVKGLKKAKIFGESLITVMPSRFESFGIVSIESQACGTPVVASDISGLRQTLIHGKTGFLCKTDEDFIYSIKKLIRDKVFYKKMSNSAFIFAKKYSWDNLAKEQLNFYKSFLRKKNEI